MLYKSSTYAIYNSVQCAKCFRLILGLLSLVISNYLFLLYFLKQSFVRMVICYFFFSIKCILYKLSTYAIYNSVQCAKCFRLILGLLSLIILNYLFLLYFLKQSFVRMVIYYLLLQPVDSSSRLFQSIIKASLMYLVCLLLKGCFIVMFLFNYLLKLS